MQNYLEPLFILIIMRFAEEVQYIFIHDVHDVHDVYDVHDVHGDHRQY